MMAGNKCFVPASFYSADGLFMMRLNLHMERSDGKVYKYFRALSKSSALRRNTQQQQQRAACVPVNNQLFCLSG